MYRGHGHRGGASRYCLRLTPPGRPVVPATPKFISSRASASLSGGTRIPVTGDKLPTAEKPCKATIHPSIEVARFAVAKVQRGGRIDILDYIVKRFTVT